jgi:hypothetical protein
MRRNVSTSYSPGESQYEILLMAGFFQLNSFSPAYQPYYITPPKKKEKSKTFGQVFDLRPILPLSLDTLIPRHVANSASKSRVAMAERSGVSNRTSAPGANNVNSTTLVLHRQPFPLLIQANTYCILGTACASRRVQRYFVR